METVVSEFYQYVEESEAWKDATGNVNFKNDFKEVREVHTAYKRRAEEKESIKKFIAAWYGEDWTNAMLLLLLLLLFFIIVLCSQ